MTDNYEYDVFISYAVQDKIFVTELVNHLMNANVKVWYSGQELRVGSSIEEIIKEGLNKSRYGVAILSHYYFIKDWPQKEFHVLWGKSDSFIIPVWHNVTMEEVKSFDALIADRWAIKSHHGADYVAKEIVNAIHQKNSSKQIATTADNKKIGLAAISSAFLFLLLAAIGAWYFMLRDLPSDKLIAATIEGRINSLQEKINAVHASAMKEQEGDAATIDQISAFYDRYNNLKAQYRNEYHFYTGYHDYKFKKNVEPALGKEIDLLTPANNYGFEYPNIYVIDFKPAPPAMQVKYIFINTQPINYQILGKEKENDSTYVVEISYQNHIRYLSVNLTYTKPSNWIKRRQTIFQGFLPSETYHFKKQHDDWIFVGLE